MAENTVQLLSATVGLLADARLQVWLFGGWAEELCGLRPPGPHRDIDLLYPARSFRPVDEFLRGRDDVEEIPAKRFPHKRAFQWQGVMVEMFLVQPGHDGWTTDFFGVHRFPWPEDTFRHTVPLLGSRLPSASPTALHLYRARHGDVEQAYRRQSASSTTPQRPNDD